MAADIHSTGGSCSARGDESAGIPDAIRPDEGQTPTDAYLDETRGPGGVAAKVFYPAAAIVGAFVLAAAIWPRAMENAIGSVNTVRGHPRELPPLTQSRKPTRRS